MNGSMWKKNGAKYAPPKFGAAIGGEPAERVVAVVGAEADLLEVVLTLGPGGGFADLLHGGEEQSDQDGDDGDHDQQLNQREPAAAARTDGERSHDDSVMTATGTRGVTGSRELRAKQPGEMSASHPG
jgi:hypothetical protein